MALTIDTTSYPSRNYNGRPAGMAIDALVLHSGEGSKASDLRELTTAGTQKSAHFYIDRAGHIYQLVDPKYRAWHAGTSSYLGRTNFNDFSVGVEQEHKSGQDYLPAQRQAITDLCASLLDRYPIQPHLVVAHRWIAPDRRNDPTDWSDAELKAWIAALFVDPWGRRWGPIATPDQTSWQWALPMAWKANWQRLGKCIGSALYDTANGIVIQPFEGGDVRQRANSTPEICLR